MTRELYRLDLPIHHVIELLVALSDRRDAAPPNSTSVYAMCNEVREQLEAQGAFEHIGAWYANR